MEVWWKRGRVGCLVEAWKFGGRLTQVWWKFDASLVEARWNFDESLMEV